MGRGGMGVGHQTLSERHQTLSKNHLTVSNDMLKKPNHARKISIAFDRRDEEPLIGFERGYQSLSKPIKRRGLIGLIGAIKSFQRVSKKLSNISNLSKPCLIEVVDVSLIAA